MKYFKVAICFLFLMPWMAFGKDLGVHGQVFPIKEQNMLEMIYERLNQMDEAGEIEQLQNEFKAKAIAKVHEPEGVHDVKHADTARVYFYDPTVVVPEDITDLAGNIIHKKGTRANPLDQTYMHETLLFIDGNEAEQVTWALEYESDNKMIILVRGRVIDLMKEHQTRLYFDQQGKISKTFGIKKYPAEVTQFGKLLKIREVVL